MSYEIISEMQRLAGLPLTESILQGHKFVHEASKDNIKSIVANGFRSDYTGTFFSYVGADGSASYTGDEGSYGGSYIYANLNIPDDKVLNFEDPPENLELDEDADGEEIADYCHKHGYWAWADGMQVAVFNVKAIQITSYQINCCESFAKYANVLKPLPIKYCPFCADQK